MMSVTSSFDFSCSAGGQLNRFICVARALMFAAILIQPAIAQGTKKSKNLRKFKKGDAVQFMYLGKVTDAEVIEVDKASRRAKLSFEFITPGKTKILSWDEIRFEWEEHSMSDIRIWTDQKKNKLKAALMEFDGPNAKFRKMDSDKLITVPISKLSDKDQRLLKKIRGTTAMPSRELPDPIEIDWTDRAIVLGNFGNPTGFGAVQPDPPARMIELDPGGIPIPRDGFFTSLSFLKAIGGKKGWLVAGTSTTDDKPVQILWGSLTDKKIVRQHLLPPTENLIAAFPEGRLVASVTNRRTFYSREQKQYVTIWNVSPNADVAEPVVRFRNQLYEDGPDPLNNQLAEDDRPSRSDIGGARGRANSRRRAEAGRPDSPAGSLLSDNDANFGEDIYLDFVDSSKIVMRFKDGSIRLIDFKERRELLRVEQDSFFGMAPRMSPGRRYLAIPSRGIIQVIDLVAQELVGQFDSKDSFSSPAVNFSADGKKLASLDRDKLLIWELGSNANPKKYELLSNISGSWDWDLDFIDDNYMLLSNNVLYDLSRQVVVWSFELNRFETPKGDELAPVATMENGKFVYATQSRRGGEDGVFVIGDVALPGDDIRQRLETANYDDMFTLGPGSSVQLSVECGDFNAEVEDTLRKLASERNWNIVPNSPAKIVATISQGQPRSATYYNEDGSLNTKVRFTPYISQLTLSFEGKNLWANAASSDAPYRISKIGIRSIEARVQAAQKPWPDFFKRVNLPPRFIKPEYLKGFGVSEIGIRGITDMDPSGLPRLPQ